MVNSINNIQKIERLKLAISDYECNLANFKSRRVAARPGEEAANLREIQRRQVLLRVLEAGTQPNQ